MELVVHKGYLRRTWGLWIFILFMAFVSFILFLMGIRSYQSAETLYQSDAIYEMKDTSTSVVIKVLDIDPKSFSIGERNFYFVKHDYGVSILEVKSEEIQTILDFKESLANQQNALENSNFYLSVRVTPEITKGSKGKKTVHITPEMKAKFYANFFISFFYKEGPRPVFDGVHILSLTDTGARIGDTFKILVAVIILLICLFIQILRIRKLKKNYRSYDELFPEYAHEMKYLMEHADYHDPSIKVLVKNNILIHYGNNFVVIQLSKVKHAFMYKNVRKGVSYYFLEFFYKDKKQEKLMFKEKLSEVKALGHYLKNERHVKISNQL